MINSALCITVSIRHFVLFEWLPLLAGFRASMGEIDEYELYRSPIGCKYLQIDTSGYEKARDLKMQLWHVGGVQTMVEAS
jgi:hypothetical protein